MKGTVFWIVMPCTLEEAKYLEEHIVSILRVEELANQ
jgi:hypothetical protein